MGIDIYAEWEGMTAVDMAAQVTKFSIEHGQVGHLREPYHTGPYTTHLLVPEVFETTEADVPAALLRERLPAVLKVAEERETALHGQQDPLEVKRVLDSFRNFVALCERKERETGKPCRIVASF